MPEESEKDMIKISQYDNTIDSRDVIGRINELEGTKDAVEQKELCELRALATEAEGCSTEWCDGAILVRDFYFKRYAEELAYAICNLDRTDQTWPLNCIDWWSVAEDLLEDYADVTFRECVFFIRAV